MTPREWWRSIWYDERGQPSAGGVVLLSFVVAPAIMLALLTIVARVVLR